MLNIVIDTNILLQCRPLNQLDWSTLDADGVRVIIPHGVIAEIDDAKFSGNSRRSKRARDVASMLGAALDRGRRDGQLGNGSVWELGTGRVAEHAQLNPNSADHRIIAEALQCAADIPNTAYLTNDVLARITASGVGLRVVSVPESWLMPPESDPRDKRLRDLEQQVAGLLKQAPQISFIVEHDGRAVERFDAQLSWPRSPNESEIAALMAFVDQTHPPADRINEDPMDVRQHILGMRREVPTASAFQAYRDLEYPKWLAHVKKELSDLPGLWSIQSRTVVLDVMVRNDGAVPADGFRIEYEVVGGALLLPQALVGKKLPPFGLSKPPTAPRVRYSSVSDSFMNVPPFPRPFEMPDFAGLRSQRDPYTFYERDESDKPTTKQAFECEELRHEHGESFRMGVLFPRKADSKGALFVRASARNMKGVEYTVPLEHTAVEFEPTEALRREILSPSGSRRSDEEE